MSLCLKSNPQLLPAKLSEAHIPSTRGSFRAGNEASTESVSNAILSATNYLDYKKLKNVTAAPRFKKRHSVENLLVI
jgi:hypothetical protein